MYAMPYDLLGRYLGVTRTRLRGITLRWRRAGLAETASLAGDPAWCWVTREGLARIGYPWTASPPPLGRLAHIRAVAACRLWLESGDAYQARRARWRSEREIRARVSAAGRYGSHVVDGEIFWPASADTRGSVWGVEVELTPKELDRVTGIIGGLLASPYERIVYLCSRPALSVVERALSGFGADAQARVSVRRLPPSALMRPSTIAEALA